MCLHGVLRRQCCHACLTVLFAGHDEPVLRSQHAGQVGAVPGQSQGVGKEAPLKKWLAAPVPRSFVIRPSWPLSAHPHASSAYTAHIHRNLNTRDLASPPNTARHTLSEAGRTSVDDLARLEDAPLVPLDVHRHGKGSRQQDHCLHAHALAVVVLGLRGPREERHNILRHLARRRGGAVRIINHVVIQRAGHADRSAGEVRVVVQPLAKRHAARRLSVPRHQGQNVVPAAVPRLDDEAEVRGQCAVVCRACGLFVLIRAREVVRELPWAEKHVALVVGSILDLDFLRKRLRFLLRVRNAHKVAESNALEAVASTAHLLVHLVPATNASVIECAERPVVRPRVVRGMHRVGRGKHRRIPDTGSDARDARRSGQAAPPRRAHKSPKHPHVARGACAPCTLR
eukprot:Opistho-1_new@45585